MTCHCLAPEVNNGHLVQIVEVVGPVKEWNMPFAYLVERIDGGLLLTATALDRRALAPASKLRPLRGAPEPARDLVVEKEVA